MIALARDEELKRLELEMYARAASEHSLRHFVRQAWHVVEPGKRFVGNWHIDAICDHLQAVSEGHIRRLIINVPPRHSKSTTTAVMWPVWTWIRQPQHQWLFSTYAQNLSVRDSVKRRRLILSPWFQARWGDRFRLAGDQNQKTRFDNDHTGYMLATSVGGQLTGEGGDTIVVDDPHNAKEGESETKREGTLEWWDIAMSTRLNDPVSGAYVIIMQRLHENDLVGHILAREHGWDHLCIPAEYETDHPTPCRSSLGFSDPRTRDGELLWPGRVTEGALVELKTKLGSRGAAGQLQQRPSPAGGAIFKRDDFAYYRVRTPDVVSKADVTVIDPRGPRAATVADGEPKEFITGPGRRFVTVDGALSEKTSADNTAMAAWSLVDGCLFMLDLDVGKRTTPEAADAVQAMMVRNNCREAFIEVDGGGLAIYQTCEAAGLAVHRFHARKWGDKEVRAHIVTPFIEQGKVLFPKDAEWLDRLESQLLVFPAGAHDDEVDAVTSAGIVAFHSGGGGEPVSTDPVADKSYSKWEGVTAGTGGNGTSERWGGWPGENGGRR